MKFLNTLLLVAVVAAGHSQTVSVMDFVKVEEGRQAEAMYFYEQNWKMYRQLALKKGYITDYRIEKTQGDSAAPFNLILITEYKDSISHAKSEENFSDILKTTRPNGPLLLNELKPADFRQPVFVKVTHTVYRNRSRNKR